MKRYLLFFSICLLSLFANAQNTPVQQWVNTSTGTISGNDEPTCSYKDNSGYTYVAGTNQGGTFISKFDNTGIVVFSTQYTDSNNVYLTPKIIQTDAAGNIYFAGVKIIYFNSYLCAVKMDAAGNVLWEKSYNLISGAPNIQAMVVDSKTSPTAFAYTGRVNDSVVVGKISLLTGDFVFHNKYLLAGCTHGFGLDVEFNGGNIYACGAFNNTTSYLDAFVMKINGAGTLMYQQIFNGTSNLYDQASDILVNTSGEVFIYGTTYDPMPKFFVRKYNASGVHVWTGLYLPPSGNNVTESVDMEFNPTLTSVFVLGQTSTAFGPNGALAVFDASSGFVTYSSIVDYAFNSEEFMDLDVDNVGNYYFAGINNSNQMILVKRNASNVELFHTYYTINTTAFTDLHVDNTGNAYLVGAINQGTSSYTDVVTAKYSSGGGFLWDGIYNAHINTIDNSHSILQDLAGNTIVVGNTVNDLTGSDAKIKKYDAHGNQIWSMELDYGANPNFILGTGQASTNDTYIATLDNISNGNVTLLDANGNVLWNAYIPYTYPGGFSVDASGGDYYVGSAYTTGQSNFELGRYGYLGFTVWSSTPVINASKSTFLTHTVSDNAGNVFAYGYMSESGTKKWLQIEKYNVLGLLQWSKTITGLDSTVWSTPQQISLDATGNPVVLGNGLSMLGIETDVLAKFDAVTGNILFKTFYNASNTQRQQGRSFTFDASGYIYVAGNYGDITYPTVKTACVQKYSATGALQWNYIYYSGFGSGENVFAKIGIDSNNDLVVSGTEAYLIDAYAVGSKLNIVKLSVDGNFIWKKIFESTYPSSFTTSAMLLNNQRIYVLGSSIMSSGPFEDMVYVKYCDHQAPIVTNASTGLPYPASAVLCSGVAASLGVSSTAVDFAWIPQGETTATISPSTSGLYAVTAIEADGCSKVSDTIMMDIKPLPVAPNICAVTVDSLSTHNIVYWDKTGYTDISHFVVYREDVTNIYTAIGSVPFDSLSEYHDYAANPNVTTKRYKITAVDTCGNESAKSPYHNTLYVSGNSSGEFSWNLYEIEGSANPVTSFELYRDDNGTGVWHVVGTTAGTQQILIDPDYGLYSDGRWRVETVWGIVCAPTRAGVSTSRSNVRTKSMISALDETFDMQDVTVYPNPAQDVVTLSFTKANQQAATITLKDATGRVVETKISSATKIEFNVTGIESGTYFIEVLHAQGKCVKHFVKN